MSKPLQILILHSSVDGHTTAICGRIATRFSVQGCRVALHPVDGCPEAALAAADAVLIGASIRYGHHRASVADFIAAHRERLDALPNAFFSVNLVARKPEKASAQTNPYARKFLSRIAWHPKIAAVFAGRLDYPSYGFLDRQMIRLIMAITGGPTDSATVVEYTDWEKVDAFQDDLFSLIHTEREGL